MWFSPAAIALLASTVSFVVLYQLVAHEQRVGRRVVLSAFRAWLDRVIDHCVQLLSRRFRHLYRYMLQLHWYYGLHSVLKTALRVIVRVYSYLEDRFETNRQRTRELRRERRQAETLTHLSAMAAHKQETALTPTQQARLRQRSLEE